MDNSIYITLSKQLAAFRDLEVTANNIANADTVGYNGEKMMFTNYLVNDGNFHKMAFVQDISTYRNLEQGNLQVTGNTFDLAISGPGYFSINTPLGKRYTKAGNFTLKEDGQLVTMTGNPVLDQTGQPIFFEITDTDVKVGENGLITARTQQGTQVERGNVGIFEFADEQRMERLGSQLFKTDQPPQEPTRARMLQGALEKSNVSPVTELIRSTELSRSTGSTAKFIEVMYDLQRKTSNSYARKSQG